MTDREIDEALKQAAGRRPGVPPELLERIAGRVGSSLAPIRPVPARWVMTAGLMLICAAVAAIGAGALGLHGVQNIGVWAPAVIFPVMGVLIWLAASTLAAEMVPGSRMVAPGAVLAGGSVVLLALFGFLFRDYQTDHFVSKGMACLTAGVANAVPAAAGGWLLLRRGFAVNPVAAGLALGTFGALSGVTMLELHCGNFQAWHVILWHTAVMPVSAAVGAWVAGRWFLPWKR